MTKHHISARATGKGFLRATHLAAAFCVALSGLTTTAAPAGAQDDLTPDLGSCRFPGGSDVTTILYDTYNGGQPSKYRLAEKPRAYLGRQVVKIPKRAKPLFLVFSSYGPTEWDMKVEPGAVISGILVLGYDSQIVSKVPPGTRVAFSTYVGGAGQDCPKGLTWTDQDLRSKVGPVILGSFNRRIDEYYRRSSGECVYVSCAGDANYVSKEPPEPQPTLWARWFGPRQPPEPPTVVRTSAPLIIR